MVFKMNNKKILLLISISLCILFTISSAYAEDIDLNDTMVCDENHNILEEVNENDCDESSVISQDNDEEVLGDSTIYFDASASTDGDGSQSKPYKIFKTDLNAPSLKTINIDVSDLEPQVACPHNVDNVKAVSEVDQEIDQVFLGSCTNGRLSDLRDAAKILKGNKIANGTRMLVIPASKEIYSKALEEGLIKIFVDAGALVSAPCCGPCLGGHTGIIGPGEVSLSTSNRNFKGRQGSPDGKVYLSSAAVAAASAIEGRIVAPE